MKKKLLSSAPWRDEENPEIFEDAKLRATNQPGSTPTMYVPKKKSVSSKATTKDNDSISEIDPELRYSFQRNFQDHNIKNSGNPEDTRAGLAYEKSVGLPTGVFFSHAPGLHGEIIWVNGTIPVKVGDHRSRSARAGFSPNFLRRVFSIDTIVKPLPPAVAYNVSRNLSFFTRIFTQFFDPEGISNAQKSLGLGQEEKARRVR